MKHELLAHTVYTLQHDEEQLVIQALLGYSCYLAGMLNCLLGVPSNPHGTPCLSIQGDLSSRVTLTVFSQPLNFFLLKWDYRALVV